MRKIKIMGVMVVLFGVKLAHSSAFDEAKVQAGFGRVSHRFKISLITEHAPSLGLVVSIREENETRKRQASFDLAMAECNLRRALELVALEPEDLRPEKLAQIRIRGEEKVREHGTLYRLLRASSREIDDDYSRSAAAQYAKACEIKGAFPEGDPIRTHLDAVWAEVSAVPAPVVPTEAAFAEHRELMRRLSEEE